MSANLEAKKQVVEEIKEKIEASKSVVLADYNKLTVLEVTALRNKFKAANCEYKVYKNTLVRKAFNELASPISIRISTALPRRCSARTKRAALPSLRRR